MHTVHHTCCTSVLLVEIINIFGFLNPLLLPYGRVLLQKLTSSSLSSVSSFASFAAIPVPGMKEKAKESIASQLSALSQHLREKKSGFYRPVTKENFLVKYNTGPVTNPIPPSNRHVPFEATRPVIQPELGEQEKTGNKIIPTLPEGGRGETDAPEVFRAERRDLAPRTPSR